MFVRSNESATITVFVCHGRLRSLDERSVDQWRELAEQEKVNVVLHNYPGYGNVAGPRTPKRIKDDCLELLEHVKGCEWAKGTELVLLGNSIGKRLM